MKALLENFMNKKIRISASDTRLINLAEFANYSLQIDSGLRI